MFKFFKSLFLTPKPEWIEDTPPENHYIPVPKWTHAPRKGGGRDIYCPKCHQTEHVKNFGWKEMTCEGCETTTTKYEWLLKK